MEATESLRFLMSALGMQSGFWGMGRITGELYAVLYVSPKPLTLAEIATELGVTKGNVSVAIRRLEELGMVRRQYQPGDRRVYFVPNVDFWDIARHFLQRRYQPAFAASFQLMEDSIGQAEAEGNNFIKERVQALKSFYDLLDRLTAVLLDANPAEMADGVQWIVRMAEAGQAPSDRRES